jgi:hypothetical protein
MDFEMPSIGQIVKVVIAVVVWWSVIDELRKQDGTFWRTWRSVRLPTVIQGLSLLIATASTLIALSVAVPFLQYGWTNLFFDNAINVVASPIQFGGPAGTFLAVAFLTALLLVLPPFAKKEEELFRSCCYEWSDIFKQAAIFGPIHCLVGVPLSAGLALIVAGIGYGAVWRYTYWRNIRAGLGHDTSKQRATEASTRVHTVYNTIAVTLLLIAVVLSVG